MLYEFQATYRTKGEAGPGPIQATAVRARSEEQALSAGVFPSPRDGKHRIPRAFIMKRLFKNIGEREVIA